MRSTATLLPLLFGQCLGFGPHLQSQRLSTARVRAIAVAEAREYDEMTMTHPDDVISAFWVHEDGEILSEFMHRARGRGKRKSWGMAVMNFLTDAIQFAHHDLDMCLSAMIHHPDEVHANVRKQSFRNSARVLVGAKDSTEVFPLALPRLTLNPEFQETLIGRATAVGTTSNYLDSLIAPKAQGGKAPSKRTGPR